MITVRDLDALDTPAVVVALRPAPHATDSVAQRPLESVRLADAEFRRAARLGAQAHGSRCLHRRGSRAEQRTAPFELRTTSASARF